MTRHEPNPPPRFLVDAMLGHVARDLRLLGLDARYAGGLDDPAVLGLAQRDGLRLITCDAALARRARSLLHLRVRSRYREEQVREVLRSLPRNVAVAPFSRCLACSEPLRRLSGAQAARFVPDHVAWSAEEFWYCRGCRKAYWRGSHVSGLEQRARDLIGFLRGGGRDEA
jgi:uncharacterized protein with PIN domain